MNRMIERLTMRYELTKERFNTWLKYTVRVKAYQWLDSQSMRLKTADEIRFDWVWPLLSDAERHSLKRARGEGLLAQQIRLIDKYLDENGRVRDEFFSNRGFNHNDNSMDQTTAEPP